MKKLVIVLGSAAVLLGAGGYGGYQYVMNLAADKISEELTSDPELMKQLDEELKKNEAEMVQLEEELNEQSKAEEADTNEEKDADSSAASKPVAAKAAAVKVEEKQPSTASPADHGETASPEKPKSSGGKEFSSRNEAVRFAMSRFSASEMNVMREMAADGLTAEEKAKLKSIAYSKFSAAEIAAVQRAVSK